MTGRDACVVSHQGCRNLEYIRGLGPHSCRWPLCCEPADGATASDHRLPEVALMYRRTFSTCSSFVRANACEPSPRATKYRKSVEAGSATAWIDAMPGLQIGFG